MALQAADLLRKSQKELDELFTKSPTGANPNGDAVGTGIVFPGTFLAPLIAWFVRWFVWQGKVIDGPAGQLINRITPFSVRAIRARVYKDKSWLDGLECTVIDYSQTSFVARSVRDEVREVEAGFYLGKVFLGRKHLCDFSIDLRSRPDRT